VAAADIDIVVVVADTLVDKDYNIVVEVDTAVVDYYYID